MSDAARPARFVIGIDLGTTNSAVAFADLHRAGPDGVPPVEVFGVPQLVAELEVGSPETLPSFLYLPRAQEREALASAVPWAGTQPGVTGTWARDHGELAPGRLVASAKSWLCHGGVDRTAAILPWGSEEAHCSPVTATAAYLAHMRDAWNHAVARDGRATSLRFEQQDIVLTVPASFDEEARELTVDAARQAGLDRLALIEEPSAALYAWLARRRGRLGDCLRDGDTLLICDVGGGTTDFTLVRVSVHGDAPTFDRTAVGEHLLLGGDNVDLAIARLVEERLGGPRLTLRQRLGLRRHAAVAKERLLGPPGVPDAPISILGAGASVVGGAVSVKLTREDVLGLVLDGFLPPVPAQATPASGRRGGLREMGLPYAEDAAITRHLAAFLRRAGGDGGMVQPDVLLFNGGFFTPPELRERLSEVVAGWRTSAAREALRHLEHPSPATAVAEGAAWYGLVRRGHGVRIGGGTPRAYFIALAADHPAREEAQPAVCVVPRGTAEGTALPLEGREFRVATNRPLAFTLLSSLTRQDPIGAVADLGGADAHRHAPLVTELRYGKRSRHAEVPVRLETHLTEVGTLELWVVAPDTGHRWRLQFQLRAVPSGREDAGTAAIVESDRLDTARAVLSAVFGDGAASPDPVMAQLEEVFGVAKHSWPVSAVRPLADALLDALDGRRRSPRHEARWLNLLGYALRPGFGATLDEARMVRARRLYLAGLAFPGDIQCEAEWLVLWQRVAGGLTAGQQQEVFDRYARQLGVGAARPRRLGPQIEREGLRLLASLERLTAARRTAVGDHLVGRLAKDQRNAAFLWALGRAGGRVPSYGPANTVVPPADAARWARAVMTMGSTGAEAIATVARLCACTGDPVRDLDDEARRDALEWLVRAGADERLRSRLLEPAPSEDSDGAVAFGETLPEGLRLSGAGGPAPSIS
jgi:molecular chaperone DnaK (HSP70)